MCVRVRGAGLGVPSLLLKPLRNQPAAAPVPPPASSPPAPLGSGAPGPGSPSGALSPPLGPPPAPRSPPAFPAATGARTRGPRCPRAPADAALVAHKYSPKKKKRQKAFAKIMLNKSHSLSVFLPWIKKITTIIIAKLC